MPVMPSRLARYGTLAPAEGLLPQSVAIPPPLGTAEFSDTSPSTILDITGCRLYT
jgi:hypothetical protein